MVVNYSALHKNVLGRHLLSIALLAALTVFESLRPNARSTTISPLSPTTPPPIIPQVSPAQPTGGRRRRATEMDPDERRQRFLERNRAAASRCRQKRKLWVNSLEKKADDLVSMNVSLSVSPLATTTTPPPSTALSLPDLKVQCVKYSRKLA